MSNFKIKSFPNSSFDDPGVQAEVAAKYWNNAAGLYSTTSKDWIDGPVVEGIFDFLGSPIGTRRVLDVAGGNGEVAKRALTNGWKTGLVVDISEKMLARVNHPQLATRLLDVNTSLSQVRGKFDVVIGRHLLPYVKDPVEILERLGRLGQRIAIAGFAAPSKESQSVFAEYSQICVPGSVRFLQIGEASELAKQAGLEVIGQWGADTPDKYGHRIITEADRIKVRKIMSSMPSDDAVQMGLDPERETFARRPWDITIVAGSAGNSVSVRR